MCTPWTITRVVRWRVRDWASCFSVCRRFSLDDHNEKDRHVSTSTPQMQIRNMGSIDTNSTSNSRSSSNNSSKNNNKAKPRLQKQQKKVGCKVKDSKSEESGSWPHFEDEDYIVFCFQDDGALDVVKKDGRNSTNSRPVNRKLHFVEDSITVDSCRKDGDSIIPEQKEYEKEERRSSMGSLESGCGGVIEEDIRMGSVESSDSTLSDTSTASFAFPVLGWEWIGSPVQMPKSEGLRFRKHRSRRCVGLQCCRF